MNSYNYLRFLCVSLLLSSHSVTAQSNTQCETDTAVISTKATSMNIEVVEPDLSCADTNAPTCTFDFGPLNTKYVTACTNTLQGVVFYQNMVLECIVPGTTTKRKFYYDNGPACYAQSCNEAAIDYEQQTLVYPLMESSFKTIYGLECDVYEKPAGEVAGQSSNAVHLITNFAVSGIVFFVVVIQSFF